MSYFIRYTDTFLSGEIFLTFNESDALEIQFFFADTLVTPLKRLLMWLHTVLTAASCFLVPNHFSTWIDTCQIIIKNKREPCIDIQLTEKFTISTGTFYIKIINLFKNLFLLIQNFCFNSNDDRLISFP